MFTPRDKKVAKVTRGEITGVIESTFPTAIALSNLPSYLNATLSSHVALPSSLLAVSISSDEVASTLTGAILKSVGGGKGKIRKDGAFNLGGLGGIPFAGSTGLKSFYSHVAPSSGGAAVICHASQVGVSKSGTVGKVERLHMTEPSAACDATTKAFGLCVKGMASNDGFLKGKERAAKGGCRSVGDYQQDFLTGLIASHVPACLQASSPMAHLALCLSREIEKQIDKLVTPSGLKAVDGSAKVRPDAGGEEKKEAPLHSNSAFVEAAKSASLKMSGSSATATDTASPVTPEALQKSQRRISTSAAATEGRRRSSLSPGGGGDAVAEAAAAAAAADGDGDDAAIKSAQRASFDEAAKVAKLRASSRELAERKEENNRKASFIAAAKEGALRASMRDLSARVLTNVRNASITSAAAEARRRNETRTASNLRVADLADLPGFPVVLLGGVLISTPVGVDDYFLPNRFVLIAVDGSIKNFLK